MRNPGYCADHSDATETDGKHATEILAMESISRTNRVRSTLAQSFATMVDCTSAISIGLFLSIPAVIIADLENAEHDLHMDHLQLSWYASLQFFSEPFGCFFGGILQNYVGRKHGILIMHVSCIITWFVLNRASSVGMIYLSAILAGASMGFSESPGLTYIGEITTPELRGIMVMCNDYSIGIGCMAMFLLCSFVSWRTASLVCIGWNAVSILFLVFIPDSPVWLLNKGRTEEALKALQWLRGWVPEAMVKSEFEVLRHFMEKRYSGLVSQRDGAESFCERHCHSLKGVFEKSTLRPFVLLWVIWFFGLHAALDPSATYFLVILGSLNLPLDPHWIQFLYAVSSASGAVSSILAVRMFGKRKLALSSIALTSLLSFSMGQYILFRHEVGHPWTFIVLYVLQGFTHQCIVSLPWILMGEVYPVTTRSMAAGLSAAILNLCFSVYVKTFYCLQQLMPIEAIFTLYSCCGLVGFLYLWIFMPETEGKTMAEIEELFADDARRSCCHFRQKK